MSNASKLDRHAYQSYQVEKNPALAALGGDDSLLKELGTMFCEDAPQVLDDFERAVHAGDLHSARRAAHSLKGLASTFFARPTIDLAFRMESEAAHGNLDALRDGGIEQLRASVAALSEELEQRGFVTT